MINPDDFSPPLPGHRADVRGVLITKGSTVTIPPGGLKIFRKSDGTLDSSIEVHLSLSMCPIWFEVAVQLVIAARDCRSRTLEAWQTTSDDAFSDALLAEAAVSMQATVASATAIDALYAAVKGCHPLPSEVIDAWRRNGTARYRQVAELLRRALDIKPRQAVLVRRALGHIYGFRDWSVHPPAQARQPLRHPTFNSVTEWRLATFTYQNAREMTRASLSLARQAALKGKNAPEPLKAYCTGLTELLAGPIEQWRSHFGELEPRTPDAAQEST